MKAAKILSAIAVILCLFTLAAKAGDYDWVGTLNIQAEADPAAFRVRLATRFRLGDVQVNAVLRNVERPADAYVFLRLGEMSQQSPDYVMEKYKANKGKGWGALAQSLGIKPGSEDFHALKRGHDLDNEGDAKDGGKGKAMNQGEGNGKGEGKDKAESRGQGNGESKGKGKGRK